MKEPSAQFTKVYLRFDPSGEEEVYVPFQEAMDALTAEKKLLSKEIERLYWMTELIEDTSDQDYVLGMERNRAIDDVLNLINPPSN